MDQSSKTDKFAELSPVLELVYVMLTNMAKYLDVYATDIEADKTMQYNEAKQALKNAIQKFDVLYGLESGQEESASMPEKMEEDENEEDTTMAPQAEPAPEDKTAEQGKSYEFASGNDPESLKKAKQAVEELKTLFADMKKQESTQEEADEIQASDAPSDPQTTPVEKPVVPAPAENSMPTFVAPTTPVMAPPTPVTPQPTPVTQSVPTETQPAAQQTPQAAPSAPAQTAQDASDVEGILAELRKLQNKGTTQL